MTNTTGVIQKGTRKSEKQVNSERHMKLYEFLMFDPIYKNMSHGAKLLYSYLDSKIYMFERKQEAFEEGIGTKSYVDEKGDLFIIADNVELMYLLNCSEPTLIKLKKELAKHGLLEEEPVKDKANRIYVLNPPQLSDRWAYISEIEVLRSEHKEMRAKKYMEQKKKKDQESQKIREEKKQVIIQELQTKERNLKNLSHGELKKFSYSDQKKLSKYKLNIFKDNQIFLNINQSISEEIENSLLPMSLKKTLISKIDRLIKFEINISDIDLHFNAVKGFYDEMEYNYVLNSLLNELKKKPRSFPNVMNDWLKRNRNRDIPEKRTGKVIIKTPVRTEPTPAWLDEDENKQIAASKSTDQEQKKKELEERLKKYKN